MPKHSQAPWINKGYGAIAGGPEVQFARGKGKRQVAAVCGISEGEDGEWEANIALVTHAPDLLAMVRQYASECAECNGEGQHGMTQEYPCGGPCDECADIRQLIAKATGEQL